MNGNSDNKKEAMLAALEKSLGVVTTAAEMVGINRDTHYEWMKKDEAYAAKVDALKEVALDFAVTALHKLIAKGDTAATIFYCKTQGKKRGFIERQEITGEEGQPIIQIAKNL
jgi:hypothetical protein